MNDQRRNESPSLGPPLPERRPRGMRPLMLGVAAAAVVILVQAISGGGGSKTNTIPTLPATASPGTAPPTPPVTQTQPSVQAPPPTTTPHRATPEAAKPTSPSPKAAPNPNRQVVSCNPIFGNGVPHPVTSSASGTPASCAEAHSVLLSALNSKSRQVNTWRCVTHTSGGTIAVCKSGTRKVVAGG
jgi:hypothetical protein